MPQSPDLHWDEDTADQGIFAQMNITPFVDVVLVLLIIFMASSSAMVDEVRQGRLDIALPQAGHADASAAAPEPLIIALAADGRLMANAEPVSLQQLDDILAQIHKARPGCEVIVDADGSLSHREVVAILDRVRAAGFVGISIGAQAQ